MKRIFVIPIAVVASMALYSCGDDCSKAETCETPILFQADPVSLLFGSDDTDAQSIFIAAMNVTWKAEVEASAQNWLKISEESKRVSVRVEENTTEQVRTGSITITPDNETLSPSVITVTQSAVETLRIPMTVGISAFYGDPYKSGIGVYVLTLAGGDAEYNAQERSIFLGNGTGIVLELLADDIVRQDYQVVDPKEGVYKMSMDPSDSQFEFERWSFMSTIKESEFGISMYYGSWLLTYAGGYCVDNTSLTDGKITVEREGEIYTIVAEVMTEFEQRIVLDFSGPFAVMKNNASYSTYTDDHQIDGLVRGDLVFRGEDPGVKDCFFWEIWLGTLEGSNGKEIYTYLYAPQADSVLLPSGVYTIANEPYGEFMARAGYFAGIMDVGTWVYEYDWTGKLSDYSPLIEGTITVNYNGGDNYSFVFDAFTDNYYKLTSTFEGDLDYYNESALSTGVPYRMESRRPISAGMIPDRNDRSVRYSLKNLDNIK